MANLLFMEGMLTSIRFLGPVVPDRTGRTLSYLPKEPSCTRSSVGARSSALSTSVMFRRAAACETMRIGTPPDAAEQVADERRVVLQSRRRPRR